MSPRSSGSNLYLYGPPGSGKTTVGQLLARALDRVFVDADERIQARAGKPIPEIFAQEGESGFRARESEVLEEVASNAGQVVALGGGALLSPHNRERVEASGQVVRLDGGAEALARRLNGSGVRPLLAGADGLARLRRLLADREAHYGTFQACVDTTDLNPEQVVEAIQRSIGLMHVGGMGKGYDVILRRGALRKLETELIARGIRPPYVVVADDHVGPLFGASSVRETAPLVTFPAGEGSKNLDTLGGLYQKLISAGLERGGAVIALGGGVVGDLAGMAAATIFRGVRWVNVPTSLLAMVDASLGGKVGVDLPEGKNLVGAFHPPSLVVSDPQALRTLPREEFAAGLAEVVKAAIVGDPELFARLETGDLDDPATLDEVLYLAIRVKCRVIEADPYERGLRASLNLGHTLGHAIEHASEYRLRHGEAIAIGLVLESRLSEALGLAEPGLTARTVAVLTRLGLPTEAPPMDPRTIREIMSHDKKTAGGRLKFALPERVGGVRVGVEAPDSILLPILEREFAGR